MPWCARVREARYRVVDGASAAEGEGATAEEAWLAYREAVRRRRDHLAAREDLTDRERREMFHLRAGAD